MTASGSVIGRERRRLARSSVTTLADVKNETKSPQDRICGLEAVLAKSSARRPAISGGSVEEVAGHIADDVLKDSLNRYSIVNQLDLLRVSRVEAFMGLVALPPYGLVAC